MLVSTKGRYALQLMLDLCQHDTGDYIVLMDVAERQGISEKYLEGIVASLSRAGLLQAQRGRGGGYRLVGPPEEYRVGSIVRAAEGSLAPVSCMRSEDKKCPEAGECLSMPMWQELDRVTNEYLDSITLADLLNGAVPRRES